MFKGTRALKDFDLFCNPNGNVLNGYYDYISYYALRYSSYIHYIVLSYDEKNILKPFVIIYDEILDYLKHGYKVIAFNHCEFVCLEVVL